MNEKLIYFDAYDTITVNQTGEPLPLLPLLVFAPIAPVAIGEFIRKKMQKTE